MLNSLITDKGNESPDLPITEKPTGIPGLYRSNYNMNFGRSLSQQGITSTDHSKTKPSSERDNDSLPPS
jgi:hypothetical protein